MEDLAHVVHVISVVETTDNLDRGVLTVRHFHVGGHVHILEAEIASAGDVDRVRKQNIFEVLVPAGVDVDIDKVPGVAHLQLDGAVVQGPVGSRAVVDAGACVSDR